MSELKRSDVFNLPYCQSNVENGPRFKSGVCMSVINTYKATAINAYDENREVIANQAADIKLLREALETIQDKSGEIQIHQIAYAALTANNQGKG